MPRSNWKGVISFGLVSIPIALFSSENTSEKVAFHQIDKRNNARIKYQRVNAETGKEVEWGNIIKGYAYDKETILPVEDDELQQVAGENGRTIAIENFVKKDEIDLIDISKTYYLVPDKKGEKGYVILREALKKSQVMGIAKVIISTKEYLAAVGCYKNALVLYLLRYQENIRPLSEFDTPSDNLKKYKVNAKEISAAQLLIKSMTSKWNPKKYKDEYQAAVHKWAERKIKHKPGIVMPQRVEPQGKVKDVEFIELLRKSLNETKKTKTAKKPPMQYIKKKTHTGKRAVLH
jgi:DNA end-binding protein Ku